MFHAISGRGRDEVATQRLLATECEMNLFSIGAVGASLMLEFAGLEGAAPSPRDAQFPAYFRGGADDRHRH